MHSHGRIGEPLGSVTFPCHLRPARPAMSGQGFLADQLHVQRSRSEGLPAVRAGLSASDRESPRQTTCSARVEHDPVASRRVV
jgi:hypothetical protein